MSKLPTSGLALRHLTGALLGKNERPCIGEVVLRRCRRRRCHGGQRGWRGRCEGLVSWSLSVSLRVPPKQHTRGLGYLSGLPPPYLWPGAFFHTALGLEAEARPQAAERSRRRCWAPGKGLTALRSHRGAGRWQEGSVFRVDVQLCLACLKLSSQLTPEDPDKPQSSQCQVQETGLSQQPEDRAVGTKGLPAHSFLSQNHHRK